ncbi:endoribonuclease Dcr-2 isoform X2 [Andrena cerasifolii]|uniref:endoribonuclease Dcr-2 isoform X2 n=1 Tax=Andrena cerasifolii TaxID=2819439 RepID=UPI004037DC78
MEDNSDEFVARPYQIDMFEIALKQNTIIYLPTGAGKTYVAVMLIKELSADIRRPYTEGGKHTVFLVNTVPLVTQQSLYIARLTGLSCGELSGDKNVDFWTRSTWAKMLEEHQVLVMTTSILVDAICHGHMLLSRINLLIFDECHRAVNDHPMRQLMQQFETCPKEDQPRILGLTASLLNSNVNLAKVESTIKSLEITFHAKVATITSATQVKNYYATPKEVIVQYNEYEIPDVGKQINGIITEIEEVLNAIVLKSSLKCIESSEAFRPKSVNKKLLSILKDIQEQFANSGVYGASKAVLLHLIQLECIKKYTQEVETAYVLEYFITELTKFRKLLEDEMKNSTEMEKIHKYSSDQVRKLFTILKNFHSNKSADQKFCCIIFVQRRFTANVLYHILKNLSVYDGEFKFLQSDFLVGYSNNPYKNSREVLCIAKWNKEVLVRFKNGLSNCVIATDVIDEGIDIPTCTLIVRYNLPMDIRAYIQSKGRARYVTSQYTLLVPRNDLQYLKRYDNFKLVESHVQKVSLKLPIVSPLKTVIFGDLMPSIDIAKRSAAMKVCIALHKIGELSDTLAPNAINSITQNTDYLFPHWVDEDTTKASLIGTYKQKRHHELQFPSALHSTYPLPNTLVYLHLLHAKPTYSAPHQDNRHLIFYNLLCSNAGFAILSTKPMPQIPSFPIFMNVGELNVDIKVNYATINLSDEEIMSIQVFHTLIFSEIVPVIKSFMVFDNHNLDNCFLITPVTETWEINWEVIRQYKYIDHIAPVPYQFDNSDYELALVVPNYRAAADVYIVTNVCEDLTPGSCFPTDNFFTYADYYKQKHGLEINDLAQPMLEVKPISRKINCIKPRGMQSEIKRRKCADSAKDLKEHLVPELCIRIKFPSLYWLKATMLPSILHRVSQLLIAEDLRVTIATEAYLGSLVNDTKWPPLKLADEEREESFEPSVEVPLDESVESAQIEPVLSGPEIDVLDTDAYNYPWTKDQEPPDVYRNIEDIQVIQIEQYCQFMVGMTNQKMDIVVENKKIKYTNKPVVPVPPLKILSVKDSHGPNPIEIMYALTSKLGHDAFDLERLETLGDSYLKFITSLFLYNTFPNYSEGPLTALKGKILGNRNLYYCGTNKHIPGRMKVDDFVPFSNFIAPAYTAFRPLQKLLLESEISPNVLYEIEVPKEEKFTGRISVSTINKMEKIVLDWESAESQTGMEHYLGVQTVSDKTVADCVEALIGVYLTTMGLKGALILLQWFEILPHSLKVNKLLYGVPQDPLIAEGNVNHFMPWASEIETKLGYKFKNRGFLLQAFTHPSYTANNLTECYQRLEFLGDAILDFLITCYIYENCGNLNPGALTDLRSALVNNITFACLAVRYGLHTALLAYASELNDAIYRFVKFQEERGHVVNDELLWILLEEDECKMAEYVAVPKALGDIFESTIGAIYLDCDKNLETVWEIIYCLMHNIIDKFSKNIPKQPIRALYEIPGACPRFSTINTVEGTRSVMVPLKVIIAGKTKLFHGFGVNKKQAKCAAAKQALKNMLYNV